MSGAVRSMTGFAAGSGQLPGGVSFVLSIKGVNHRFLDLQFRLPAGWDALEVELRRAVRERVQRGHLTVSVELRRDEAGALGVQVNGPLLDRLVHAWREAAERLGLRSEPALGDLLRISGVVQIERGPTGVPGRPEEWWPVVQPLAEEIVEAFDAMRRREGEDLAAALRESVKHIQAGVTEARMLREQVKTTLFTRLQGRLAEMLGGMAVSEERLLQEAALLADRSDVEEEAVRLQAHTDRFLQVLAAGGPVGKPLDFLLQEFQREANTMLSKTGAAAGEHGLRLTEIGLALKTEIERAREQVQNLE